MAKKPDGGPAYPNLGVIDLDRRVLEETPNHGMSLRDWFAGQALGDASRRCGHAITAAEYAYKLADAMLKEREKD
jgi:hypothetical protein